MMFKLRAITFVLAGLSAVFAASALAGSAADNISVSNPYVRAVPPGQPNSAAFLVLKNADSADHSLVKADSPAASVVELHTHVQEGGMMKMRPVEKIDVKAGSEAVLQPGGLHIMMMDLKKPLNPGDNVPITLTFEDGSSKSIDAPVQKLQMQMKTMEQGMQHGMQH